MKKYEIGDYLMHESSGVCQVAEITEMALSGKGSEKMYYSLVPVFQKGSQVFTPIDGAKVRLRDVTSREDIEALLVKVPDLDVIWEDNDRARAEKFKEHMALFEPEELARVVKTVHIRKEIRIRAGKKVMSSDEKVLAVAGKKLFEEMAFALNEDLLEAEKLFYKGLTLTEEKCINELMKN